MADDTITTNEEWRAIPGYEGFYEVSNLGRVASIPRPWCRTRKILKPGLNGPGYAVVELAKNKIHTCHLVHRLVLLAFIGPAQNGMQVNHVDYCRHNNALINLEYCTPAQNTRHSIHNLKRGKDHYSFHHPEWCARGDKSGARKHPERLPRGDRHPLRINPSLASHGERNCNSKLKEADIPEIRKLLHNGESQAQIGRIYGVSQVVINRIAKGTGWKHVK